MDYALLKKIYDVETFVGYTEEGRDALIGEIGEM